MGWFGKKDKKKKLENVPSLPEMPRLPELPKIGDDLDDLPQLPSYPSNSLGEKFSHRIIKDVISGGKAGDEEVFKADESFPKNTEKMMRKPPMTLAREISEEDTEILPKVKSQNSVKIRTKETEPVFVRMDKFEESLEIFEKSKKKISEIEKYLVEIKRVREKEETELQEWENEIQTIKKQFEKIDNNLFSKI